jgi:hypothetical protein
VTQAGLAEQPRPGSQGVVTAGRKRASQSPEIGMWLRVAAACQVVSVGLVGMGSGSSAAFGVAVHAQIRAGGATRLTVDRAP